MTEFHAYSLMFPELDERGLNALAADIATNALMEPITVFEGKILDGKCRYLACKLADVEPTYREYVGDEPLQFVASRNLYRQHLNETQRAIVAKEVYKKSKIGTVGRLTLDQVAAQMNVSKRQIQKTKCLDHASDTIKAMAKSGTVSLHRVSETVKQSAAITGINPNTENTADRKRLHETQDKIMQLEE